MQILAGNPEEKSTLGGRPKRIWEDNIRTDLRGMWWRECDVD
jgi:hypothetical protein